MTNIFLNAQAPFLLPSVVRSHGWVQLAPFTLNDNTGGFSYVDRLIDGRVVDLAFEAAPGGVLVSTAAGLSEAEQAEVAQKARWMLGLEQDFTHFYALALQEPKLAHVQDHALGRVLRSPILFEDVVKTILTTNTLWAGTKRMVSTLCFHYGESLPVDPSRHTFPSPARLAELDEPELRATARLGYRAPYVLALSRAVAGGALDLEALKVTALPTPELRKQLRAIKGLGDYAVAHMLLLLGRYDFIPVDSWALKLVSREWHDSQPVSRAEVEAAFAAWGEWKGLAFWFWNWSNPE